MRETVTGRQTDRQTDRDRLSVKRKDVDLSLLYSAITLSCMIIFQTRKFTLESTDKVIIQVSWI